MARGRAVPQQLVGAEVVGDVDLRQQVAVEVLRADREAPALHQPLREGVASQGTADGLVAVLDLGHAAIDTRAAAIVRGGQRIGHVDAFLALGVEQVGAVLEVVGEDDRDVAAAVEVGQRRGACDQDLAGRDDVDRHEVFRRRRIVRALRPRQEQERRAAGIIDDKVGSSVLVEIGSEAAHRPHRRARVERGLEIGVERERLVALAGARRRRDDHLIGRGLDVAYIVRQAVAVDVGQRRARAQRRHEGVDVLQVGMHRADHPPLRTRHRRQRMAREGVRVAHLAHVDGGRHGRQVIGRKRRRQYGDRDQPAGMPLEPSGIGRNPPFSPLLPAIRLICECNLHSPWRQFAHNLSRRCAINLPRFLSRMSSRFLTE